MRLEYDEEIDAAYIYIVYPINEGEVKNTIELNDNIILDFDKEGRLLGMEILNASKIVSEKVLVEAKQH